MNKQFWLEFLDVLDVVQAVSLVVAGFALGVLTMILAVVFGFIWKNGKA